MSHLLGEAGRAALKAFLSALIVVAIGVSAEPDLNRAKAVGVAGLFTAGAIALAVFQTFVPQISFRAWVPDPWGPMLDSFFHAAVGAFIASVTGFLGTPDLNAWKSILVAAVVGAINAGLRAVQGSLTPGERPAVVSGLHLGAVEPAEGPVRARTASGGGRLVLLPA